MSGGVAEDLASWEQVRRYAVPRSMIEAATGAREAGDWRGACAVSNVDITFELRDVGRHHGGEVADQLAADLRHLAPDLVRWHLPRVLGGRSTLSTDVELVLATYGPTADGPHLIVRTPKMVDGPQRLRLGFGAALRPETGREWWHTSRHLWHAQHTDELRRRYGGGDRSPFFHRDGTPLTGAELPTGRCPDDPAGRTEWLTARSPTATDDLDAYAVAFAAAGITFDPTIPDLSAWEHRQGWPLTLLARLPLAVDRLAPELVALRADQFPADRLWAVWLNHRLRLLVDPGDAGTPRARLETVSPYTREREKTRPAWRIPRSSWARPPDLGLVRAGLVTPDELHPLVRRALFPDRPTDAGPVGPPAPAPPAPVVVRCGGEWHPVLPAADRFATAHTAEEVRRERAMAAFGGTPTGCFAAQRAWTSGEGRLPRGLRAHRLDLFNRVQHGDMAGVLALLDAGLDPAMRDGRKRTLLHHLNKLDHDVLLPRLLAVGLDLEARDHHERTPLHVAVGDGGSESLVRALLAAGAATDVVDHEHWTLRDLIRRRRRKELDYLYTALADLADRDGYEWFNDHHNDNTRYGP